MNNQLVFFVSFALIIIILATTFGWAINVNAQDEPFGNSSSLGTNKTPLDNGSLIITPWNTGNDRNSGGIPNIG